MKYSLTAAIFIGCSSKQFFMYEQKICRSRQQLKDKNANSNVYLLYSRLPVQNLIERVKC